MQPMEIDKNIPVPTISRGAPIRISFDGFDHGSSVWTESHLRRSNLLTAFKRWAERTGSTLIAKSARVGADDPRGAGYRVWFLEGGARED